MALAFKSDDCIECRRCEFQTLNKPCSFFEPMVVDGVTYCNMHSPECTDFDEYDDYGDDDDADDWR